MTSDSDPVSVTLTRAEWQAVKRTLYANGHDVSVLQRIKYALDPLPAPDPYGPIVPGVPKGQGWPVLKSAKDAEGGK